MKTLIETVAEKWPLILTAGNPVMPYDSTKQTQRWITGYIPSGIVLLDQLVEAWKPRVVYNPIEPMPAFDPKSGAIELLHPNCYKNPVEYAHSVAHELAHWTGTPERLNRETMRNKHRPSEEVAADLTAAMVLDKAGALGDDTLELVATYTAHWLTVGLADYTIERLLFAGVEENASGEQVFERAAKAAQETFTYLLTRVNGEQK